MHYFQNPLLQNADTPPPGYSLVGEGRRIIRDDDMVFVESERQWAPAHTNRELVGARVHTDGVMGVAARMQ